MAVQIEAETCQVYAVHGAASCFRTVLIVMFAMRLAVFGSPAPAPTLQTPANGAVNSDPDGILTWTWTDDLISNGSFETGFAPGWYAGGINPAVWSVSTMTSNTYGMGLRFATGAFSPSNPTNAGQLIQDITIPASATSAILAWNERIWTSLPTHPPAQFKVMLYQDGSFLNLLENNFGSSSQSFVSRSTNLLVYAGQSLQLVFEARGISANTYQAFYADVDNVSFLCNHTSRPPFEVLLSTSSNVGPADRIGTTSALNFSLPLLQTNTTYYWKIGAARDGVTNYSSRFSFRTGVRVLPKIVVQYSGGSSLNLAFSTKTTRSYTLEQRDGLAQGYIWYDRLSLGRGLGSSTNLTLPLPGSSAGYWRIRVDP
jgi:hypothetical protein